MDTPAMVRQSAAAVNAMPTVGGPKRVAVTVHVNGTAHTLHVADDAGGGAAWPAASHRHQDRLQSRRLLGLHRLARRPCLSKATESAREGRLIQRNVTWGHLDNI